MTGSSRRLTAEQSVIVGRNMRVLRWRAGWTQTDLAKAVGRSVSRISRTETGERAFTGLEVMLVAAVFQVNPAELITKCFNCKGVPPWGFACIACGAESQVAAEPVARPAAGSAVFPFPRRGKRRLDVSTADIVRLRDDERMSWPAISRKTGLTASGVRHRYYKEKRKARGSGDWRIDPGASAGRR